MQGSTKGRSPTLIFYNLFNKFNGTVCCSYFSMLMKLDTHDTSLTAGELPYLPYYPSKDCCHITQFDSEVENFLSFTSEHNCPQYRNTKLHNIIYDQMPFSLNTREEDFDISKMSTTPINQTIEHSEIVKQIYKLFHDKEDIYRLIQYYKGCRSEDNSSLWSDLYKPSRVNNIIGNANNMEMLLSWLSERKIKKSASKKKKKKKYKEDDDKIINTMLLVGPSGIGKSASVHACASELGYRIIESNSSNKRTGSTIMSILSEVTQSQVIENSSIESSQDTILLFEEIDVIFEEDTGFFHALKLLIEQSKRPIILTCNGLPYFKQVLII
jgi:hypothetical protein